MRNIILIATALFCFSTINAQDIRNNFYVKTLQQEMQRNIERLSLPDLQKPFFISYKLRNTSSFNIRADRGQILSMAKAPSFASTFSVVVRVGNYHRNFDYMGSGGSMQYFPDEADADEMKRMLWLETDRAYKNAAQQYNSVMTSLKRVNVDEKELALDDMAKITPIVQDFGGIQELKPDVAKIEAMMQRLSSIFSAQPQLTTSNCNISFFNSEEYLVTTEGTIIRRPTTTVNFSASASTTDEKGNSFGDSWGTLVKEFSELPSEDSLAKEINKIIENIALAKKAKKYDEAYLGPVLFEGDAAISVVDNFFTGTLNSYRKPVTSSYDNGTNYEEKIGQRLVSPLLSVTAIPSMKSFKGQATTGFFEIDDEGVKPLDSLVLVDKGILKGLLNDRTPTHKYSTSQGFARDGYGRQPGPGVLKFASSHTIPADSMRSQLIKLAKEEGQPFAYIFKTSPFATNQQLVEKINVNTGESEMVNSCKIAGLNMRSLRRFAVASEKVILSNESAMLSIITPESFIINEVEIEKVNTTVKPKPIIVTNPLLEKKTVAKPTVKK